MENNATPSAVPLIERLRSVPIDAIDIVDCKQTPYGAMCHEAAAYIAMLQLDLKTTRANFDYWRGVIADAERRERFKL